MGRAYRKILGWSSQSTTTARARSLIDGACGLPAPSVELRSRHGDRLVVLYGWGVAAIEVAPRGRGPVTGVRTARV
jgi:hypothetical protein